LLEYPEGKGERILEKFDGNNEIVLTLPDDLTTDDVKWLSVWCRKFSVNFGDILFENQAENVNTIKNIVHEHPWHQWLFKW
jgi:hypothetical protein